MSRTQELRILSGFVEFGSIEFRDCYRCSAFQRLSVFGFGFAGPLMCWLKRLSLTCYHEVNCRTTFYSVNSSLTGEMCLAIF
jgi:hypothetical protein